MRPLALAAVGAILLLPTLKPATASHAKSGLTFRGFIERLVRSFGDILGLISSRDHRKPSPRILVTAAGTSAAFAWLIGFDLQLAAAVGIASAGALILRRRHIDGLRRSELEAAWPAYLERTRSKMLASSRSLAYVIFEEGPADSPFLEEVLTAGGREFENSGDLMSALKAALKVGDGEEITSYVCESLLDTLGSTSAQVESQLSTISETVRARNELKRETYSRLAGVRTARVFIAIIPLGMATAGVAFAGSAQPFMSSSSLLLILAAFAVVAGCWAWSSNLMNFPTWRSATKQKTAEGEGVLS